MLWQLLIISFAGWLIYDYLRRNKLFKSFSHIPEVDEKSFPLIGQSHIFLGSSEDRMAAIKKLSRTANKEGGVVRLQMGRRLFLAVSDAELADSILKCCLEKDDLLKGAKYVLGNGSIFAPVSIWRPRRKVLAPTFTPKLLNQFVSEFAKGGQELVKELKQVSNDKPIPLWGYLTTFTMDTVCKTTLNVKLNSGKKYNHPFLKAFQIGSACTAERVLQPWMQPDFIYKLLPQFRVLRRCKIILNDFIAEIVTEKRKAVKESHNDKYNPEFETFLDKLLEPSRDNILLSDVEVREECLVLTMAGTDTSAIGLAFTLSMIAKYQRVQEKVYKEIKEVFGTSNRSITSEDLVKLKYLDAVVRESLRLYPPAPMIMRMADKHITLPNGVELIPGMGFLILIWGIHRNPVYWGQDADVFRPERFLESHLLHPAAFMAFSQGPRNCIGYQFAMMSMKTAVVSIIRAYQILPQSDQSSPDSESTNAELKPGPEESIRLKFDILMQDVDNFMVRLKPRKGD